jgi:hypothetical protein
MSTEWAWYRTRWAHRCVAGRAKVQCTSCAEFMFATYIIQGLLFSINNVLLIRLTVMNINYETPNEYELEHKVQNN